ncbi:MAG: 5'-methylthioadenosine/adenosylhomocysteine nucleosidase [Clostridia bacterium]|nr:5'-methylthioadenosine/adenosylhomocysteine nucleosidase [Clostridia bacterium]
MIGILGAMSVEIDAVKHMVSAPECKHIGGVEFVKGRIGTQEVVVAQCGIGKVFAGIAAQTMILCYGVDAVINVGVAGTLSEKVGLLELAIATEVVQHDMDTSALGDPVGMISGINKVKLPASEALCEKIAEAAKELGIPYACGVIASGDRFIADRAKKEWIRDTFDAIACEMEGAAIGQVCYVGGVDFAILRAISDNADDAAGSMDYPTLCERAAKQTQRLIAAMFAK